MGQSRNENILENILGASNPLGAPQSREEALLMQLLEKLKKLGFNWLGVTTTEISDGSEISTISINGESVEVKHGDIAEYGDDIYMSLMEIFGKKVAHLVLKYRAIGTRLIAQRLITSRTSLLSRQ